MKTLKSWVPVDPSSDFSIHNLPFGIYSQDDEIKKVGVAIGDKVVSMEAAAQLGCFDSLMFNKDCFRSDYLNEFISLGKSITSKVRELLQDHLTNEDSPLKLDAGALLDKQDVMLHLPVQVGDYTDFYSSIEHATNVGKMFRDPENALLPNWKHIPVAYHGRASSIILSGQDVHRPYGQLKPNDGPPVYEAVKGLDFELEMAFIIGKSTLLGESIDLNEAEEHIFGMVIFNDWSSRDVQRWEYVPLGPFLAKNFASSISPWVVTMEALDDFRVSGPKQEPAVLSYLQYTGQRNYDINLEVGITPYDGEANIVSKSNFKYMYWNMAQQLTHHTMNGCNVNVGDMMASGTISGKDENSYGSMLELAWGGKKPLTLSDGTERKFIQDNDTVTMKAFCEKEGVRVGFGEVSTKILPAKK